MLGSDQKALDDRVALACGDDRGGKGHAEADSLAGVRVSDRDRDRSYAPVGFVIRFRKPSRRTSAIRARSSSTFCGALGEGGGGGFG